MTKCVMFQALKIFDINRRMPKFFFFYNRLWLSFVYIMSIAVGIVLLSHSSIIYGNLLIYHLSIFWSIDSLKKLKKKKIVNFSLEKKFWRDLKVIFRDLQEFHES